MAEFTWIRNACLPRGEGGWSTSFPASVQELRTAGSTGGFRLRCRRGKAKSNQATTYFSNQATVAQAWCNLNEDFRAVYATEADAARHVEVRWLKPRSFTCKYSPHALHVLIFLTVILKYNLYSLIYS